MKQQESSFSRKIWVSIFILIGLFVIGAILSAVLSAESSDGAGADTAIIRIVGPIVGDGGGSVFSEGVASSTEIVEFLERARDDDNIKAVILEINSPGGSAVASDEIGQAVKDVRAHNKTVVAWVREVGASGGYWIASSSDHIVANRMSITGSIGVISSYLEFDEFIDDWNVSYNRLVAGERKDVGDPFTNLTGEKRAFLQHKLDRIHRFFIEEVARNRDMEYAEVAKLADGSFYLGVEARDVGLVDELGGKQEALDYIEAQIGETPTTVIYQNEWGFFDELFGIASRDPPSVQEFTQTMESSVPSIQLK